MRKIISLFDRSGTFVVPWLEAGYECHIIDIVHPPGMAQRNDGVFTHGLDLRTEPIPPFDSISFAAAWPPCTHLATTGAQWFKGKGLFALSEAIYLFAVAAQFCEQSKAPYLIENPVSTISTYWRKPDYSFHPYEFTKYCEDDNYTKKTCLWVGGGFVMPAAARLAGLCKPDADRIRHATNSEDRIETPRGFSRAVFEENSWRDAGLFN